MGGAGGQQFWSGAEETDEAEMDWPLAAVSCIFGQDSVIEDTTGPSQTVTCEMVSEARLQDRVHGQIRSCFLQRLEAKLRKRTLQWPMATDSCCFLIVVLRTTLRETQ